MDSKCRPYGRLDPMKSGPQDAILPHNAAAPIPPNLNSSKWLA